MEFLVRHMTTVCSRHYTLTIPHPCKHAIRKTFLARTLLGHIHWQFIQRRPGSTAPDGISPPPDPGARDFILQNTEITRDHLTPEIPLRLITPSCSLWHATADQCPYPDPFWGFYWPGGQALTRLVHIEDTLLVSLLGPPEKQRYPLWTNKEIGPVLSRINNHVDLVE